MTIKRNYLPLLIGLVLWACNNSSTPPSENRTPPIGAGGGEVNVTCSDIPQTDLPTAVRDFITEFYSDFQIDDTERCTASDGKVYYRVDIEKGQEDYDIYFDENGAFVLIRDENSGNTSTTPPTKRTVPNPPGGTGGGTVDIRCEIDFPFDDIPQAAKDYLSTNYPGFNTSDVDVCRDSNGNIVGYEVEVERGELEFNVYFDTNGNHLATFNDDDGSNRPPVIPPTGGNPDDFFCNIERSVNDLPNEIVTVINNAFPTGKIDDVWSCHNGTSEVGWAVEVEFDDDDGDGDRLLDEDDYEIYLFFDLQGNYLFAADNQGGFDRGGLDGGNINPPPIGGNNVFCSDDGSFNDLPTAAQSYIAQNFPDYTIDDVDICRQGADRTVVGYKVELDKEGSPDVVIYFDAPGNFVN